MNPLFSTAEIQSYLDRFPKQSRRRGHHYYRDHAVAQVSCVEADRKYAAVVSGSEDYELTFEYDAEAHQWEAECTCPVSFECKHIFAAMLALQANAAKLAAPQPVPSAKPGRKKTKAQPVAVQLREEPQPPASPLATALTRALGRKLEPAEADYVQRTQWLYTRARGGYSVTTESLGALAPLRWNEPGWTALKLWPEMPKDDLEFWLYCAWELRRRGAGIPEFLAPVTDFALIEPAMQAWERRKSIESWRANLATDSTEPPAQADPVDFRLMIFPDEVCVQWKTASEKKFNRLKQTHLRRFNDEYRTGKLAVQPEATGLWLALYNPYDSYTGCHFEFNRPETSKMLGRVLRVPDLAGRVVTPEEKPLERPVEALRYQLQPALAESDDYQVSLALPDGSPSPPILLALPGQPALYLSERAVFHGPPPHQFELREPLRIPAPALETLEGVNFLQRLNLEMPPRIAERTRRIAVAVKVMCELKPTYQGSDTDAVFIRVAAHLEGGETEYCASWGWQVPQNSGHVPRKNGHANGNGFIPLVDRSAQRHFPARLEGLGAKWDDYYSRWKVRLNKTFPEVFLPWLEALPPEVEVQLDPQLATLRDSPVSGRVQLDLEEVGVDWFDLKVALNVSEMSLTQEELKLLLNARGGYVRLGKKGWRRLQFDLTEEDNERLARLGLNASSFSAEPQRLHALQLADEAARKFLPEETVERVQRRAAEIKTRVTPAVPQGIGAQLRPYQVEGFHFLAYLTANHFGGVLADDMGLGKTLQTLTWLSWLRGQRPQAEEGRGQRAEVRDQKSEVGSSEEVRDQRSEVGSSEEVRDQKPEITHHASRITPPPLTHLTGLASHPSLVICPKSVMDNWLSEAQRFCVGLKVRLWAGEDAAALADARAEADLIVLNYAQLRSLSPEIAQFQWQAVILDEAQYIKNPESQTAQAARSLKADHRLALTGTPIENRLLDLWSIFAFVMPGVLGNRAQFGRLYDQQEDPFSRRRLAARVRPFLLRRAKGQVAKDLPDRVEEDLICEMEGEQKTLYRAEFKRAQLMLLNVNTQKELNEQRFNFLASLLRLRQICCHPALVSEKLRKAESAKLNALLDLLEPLMEEGHKVLVFSQFVTMLDLLRETITEREWNHFYLAGETENRGALVEKFQAAKGAAVFLISLKAGGFGLNLTAASYVVLFDPWWNPAVEMQAIDRTHRIGQTSKVMAYRLLIKDSIEQKIRQLQRAKAALAQDVLGEEKFSQSLTLDDLRFLFAGD